MTALAFVLPYRRVSPLYIPRRDLLVASSDSLSLSISVVESDDPTAAALQLLGGTGFPQLAVKIWREPGQSSWYWDYGAWWDVLDEGDALWSGVCQVGDGPGEFVLSIPAGDFSTFPLRCRWAVQLAWDGQNSEILATGVMTVVHGGAFSWPVTPTGGAILDGDNVPLMDGEGNPIVDGA